MRNSARKVIIALLSIALLAVPAMASASGRPAAAKSRAATTSAAWVVGARAVNWAAANSKICPLRDQRIYYTGALPSKYSGTECSKLPAAIWCIISYGTPSQPQRGYHLRARARASRRVPQRGRVRDRVHRAVSAHPPRRRQGRQRARRDGCRDLPVRRQGLREQRARLLLHPAGWRCRLLLRRQLRDHAHRQGP